MADDGTNQVPPTGEANDAAPSVPAIDPVKFAELQRFHEDYAGFITAAEPYANTVNKIVQDPEFRNLVDSASKAREALAPQDDTPEYARTMRDDLKSVRADLDAEKAARSQPQAMLSAQQRVLEIANRYPAIAADNYKIANDIAAKLKDRNI